MHRELFYCDKTQDGYEEVYEIFKEQGGEYTLDWITWQLEDEKFFTKEQAFDLLYYFINRYSKEYSRLKFEFKDEGEETNESNT